MKTSTVIAIVVGVLLSFASVAGAVGYLWSRDSAGVETPPPRGLPAVWPTKQGQAPRDVPMPTGEMVAALPGTTAGHVLCQSLSQQRWEEILGGRTLREALDGACHLVTDTLEVTLRLDKGRSVNPASPNSRPVVVAGHDGVLEYLAPKINSMLNVTLATPPANPTEYLRPFLHVGITRDPNHRADLALDAESITIAGEVIAATMTPGLALPRPANDQSIPMTQVEPAGGRGVLYAAWPLVSWELCTTLARELGVAPATAKPLFTGECTVRGVRAVYSDSVSPRVYPGTIAERPALIGADQVAIKLTDDSTQTLTLTGRPGPELSDLATRVLPALLGR